MASSLAFLPELASRLFEKGRSRDTFDGRRLRGAAVLAKSYWDSGTHIKPTSRLHGAWPEHLGEHRCAHNIYFSAPIGDIYPQAALAGNGRN